jgi:Spx/MgsR family transcriptional regulator
VFNETKSALILISEDTQVAVIIYGIKNCDTMKKARSWLEAHGIDHEFHDYKSKGIEVSKLKEWAQSVGWEVLLNRAGTTFKALGEAQKADLTEAKALNLMVSNPSMIKRPVLEIGHKILVGFKPEVYANQVP